MFYPFFYECSLQESNIVRKEKLVRLSVGSGGLIITRNTLKYYLYCNNSEFIIPVKYTVSDHRQLNSILWNDDSEYSKLECEIKRIRVTFPSAKKCDRMRMIDEFILNNVPSMNIARKIRNVIVLAIVLKLILSSNIVYSNGKISSIDGTTNFQSLNDKFNTLTYVLTKICEPIKFVPDTQTKPSILEINKICIDTSDTGSKN